MGQAVGAQHSEALVSALKAAEGVAAEGSSSVGVVGGTLRVGDACCRVISATEPNLLFFVSWEDHSVS